MSKTLLRTFRPFAQSTHRHVTAIFLAAFIGGITANADAATLSFRRGANGYTGNTDMQLRSASPDGNYSGLPYIYVYPTIQGLTRFSGIIGNGANQIPAGSTILSATLQFTQLENLETSGTIKLHRMIRSWSTADTWNSMGNGIQRDDVEALAIPTAVGGGGTFDVTADVQAWLAGSANQGWAMIINDGSPANYYVYGENFSNVNLRPILTVEFTPPAVPVTQATWGAIKSKETHQ